MRDPLDDLSALRGVDVDPLPATEIRAQGDRLRRRRTAVSVTGAAAAAAAMALTASLLGGGVDGSSPTVYQFVRVGSGVLALAESSEGNEAGITGTVADLTALSEVLAPQMCVFTSDGCAG